MSGRIMTVELCSNGSVRRAGFYTQYHSIYLGEVVVVVVVPEVMLMHPCGGTVQ